MRSTTVVVVGAGHCGLSMSRHLTDRSIDHVVLERGEVASSWRAQRWDSLRLLTPNWMTRLPGFAYSGTEPDGFLTAAEVAQLIADYAAASAAPVITGIEVTSVSPQEAGFVVTAGGEQWRTSAVVLACGITRPELPAVAAQLPEDVVSVPATDYRNPEQLPDGEVLVVGGSASGVQIAEEVHRSGRPVTLSTGEHVRLPRRYRDRDILWWMDAVGVLDEPWHEIDDIVRARHVPSAQLAGGLRTVGFNELQSLGVHLVGKFQGVRDGSAQFSGSLVNACALADLKLNRLLATIDEFAGGSGERFEPTATPPPTLSLDLRRVRSVVWATGIKPDFSWVEVPAFDHRGRLKHDGGVTAWSGLYVLGLPVLRRRRSSFIDGASGDTAAIATKLCEHLASVPVG